MHHRVQGDTMFNLKEENLNEMGVSRIGDRLYLVDCLQSLYEELTTWKKVQENKMRTGVSAGGAANLLPGAGGADPYKQAQASGRGGAQPTAALKKLLAQGYSMQEVMGLVKGRPELMGQLFQ